MPGHGCVEAGPESGAPGDTSIAWGVGLAMAASSPEARSIAYVLVTLVSGEITGVGPFGDANDKNGIYRLERNGSFTLVADIGAWSVANPPVPAFFVDRVDRNGSIKEVATLGNVVPTGLEVAKDRVFFTEAGPIRMNQKTAKSLPCFVECASGMAAITAAAADIDRARGCWPAGRACHRRRHGVRGRLAS